MSAEIEPTGCAQKQAHEVVAFIVDPPQCDSQRDSARWPPQITCAKVLTRDASHKRTYTEPNLCEAELRKLYRFAAVNECACGSCKSADESSSEN